MHSKSTAALPVAELVLDVLPSGEYAWLRPNSDVGEADDALYVVTDRGRRAIATANCFGSWPTVAEVGG